MMLILAARKILYTGPLIIASKEGRFPKTPQIWHWVLAGPDYCGWDPVPADGLFCNTRAECGPLLPWEQSAVGPGQC